MIVRLVLTVALLLAITAQTPSSTLGRAVRIGHTPAEAYSEPSFAQDSGLFQRAGLNVDVQIFSSGPVVATAVANGTIDVGVGSTITIAAGAERGIPFVIIGPA